LTGRAAFLNAGVLLAILEMRDQVLVCYDVFFPGVRQNWCFDRFCWRLGSGCGGGTVRNEVWCRDLYNEAANRIYQRTSFALLRERIRHNRRELDHTSRELLTIHLRLGSLLSQSDWFLIDQLTFEKAARVGDDSKTRQLRKFSRLHKKQHPTSRTSKETVINLSGRTLDEGT
jgi:hypothetical protein